MKASYGWVLIMVVCCLLLSEPVQGWGFYAHERIHKHAVFRQPPELYGFYRNHLETLVEESVTADKRRYAVEDEGPRHYIDLDHYGEYPFEALPRPWEAAKSKYTEDTLQAYGILPWHVTRVYDYLVDAFQEQDVDRIIRHSADLGHYVSDANSPLHTTENYNGQLTGQTGIHALWESRLPELFDREYDFLGDGPYYIRDPLEAMFEMVLHSHRQVDTLLRIEREVRETFPEDGVYAYEQRGQRQVRVFSKAYCRAYHDAMGGMVEHFMRKSIHDVASFWYSAWVDAGQPHIELPDRARSGFFSLDPHKEYLDHTPEDFKGRPDH